MLAAAFNFTISYLAREGGIWGNGCWSVIGPVRGPMGGRAAGRGADNALERVLEQDGEGLGGV